MSTTSIKTYGVAPYYDDFDETKNYQRILFRPGRSVQARELTQMQSALQAQIDRHGQYAFKDGSRVVNGEASLNVEHEYIKVEGTFTHSGTSYTTANYLSEIVKGTILTGTGNSGNQVKAIVDKVVAATGSDPDTLYIKYLDKGDANRTTEKFALGEVVSSDTSSYGPATARDLDDLKTTHKNTVDSQAYGLLQPNDWYVVRNQEAGTAIPADWTTFRTGVRTTADSMKTKIDAVSDVDALAALYVYDPDTGTRPLGEWPEAPSN